MDQGAGFRERQVRIHTVQGPIEGRLRLGAGVRTLDDLNQPSRPFVRVYEPRGWLFDLPKAGQPVAINKSSILFVVESSHLEPRAPGREGGSRAPMSLQVDGYVVRGFVHIPRSGDPFARLNQSTRPFVALTSASVIGPDEQLAATFIAVNRSRIVAAQELAEEDADQTVAGEEASALG